MLATFPLPSNRVPFSSSGPGDGRSDHIRRGALHLSSGSFASDTAEAELDGFHMSQTTCLDVSPPTSVTALGPVGSSSRSYRLSDRDGHSKCPPSMPRETEEWGGLSLAESIEESQQGWGRGPSTWRMRPFRCCALSPPPPLCSVPIHSSQKK